LSHLILVIATVQIFFDVVCIVVSAICAYQRTGRIKLFFIFNTLAFFAMFYGDIYYNYFFRILKYNIADSLNMVVTSSMVTFQLLQTSCWILIARIKNVSLLSINNLVYPMFAIILIGILIYYFMNGAMPVHMAWYQSINITLNMLAWLGAIICLSRSTVYSLTILSLGCLLIISAALTADSLFMFNMEKLASANSVHITWTLGTIIMGIGFITCLKQKDFTFCPNNSIQVRCCTWMSVTTLLIVVIVFSLLFLFCIELNYDISSLLWSMPILLMFSMIASVLAGNYFSNIMLLPINNFLTAIRFFKEGKLAKADFGKYENKSSLFEFNMLGTFINDAFIQISNQLEREIKLSAQIAHDIRSPLTALESITRRLPVDDEDKKILLRDTINHIRDITNNLEKNNLPDSTAGNIIITQIIKLLEYVISERRAAFSGSNIEIISNFDISCYGYFIEVVPSEMKRVLTNIINNAYDAVKSVKNPKIVLTLERDNDTVNISISDNGVGLPSNLHEKVFTRGFTTKENGSGLGLHHAKEILNEWHGHIELSSNSGKGCTVKLELPAKEAPIWFISQLSFLEKSFIICVDDSISILNAWRDRFDSLKSDVILKYCSSEEDLDRVFSELKKVPYTFLIDYEFSGSSYTGIDLVTKINKLNLPSVRIFLVTSHSSEPEIQDFCVKNEIYLISKLFSLKIPINIINGSKIQKIVLSKYVETKVFEKKYKNANTTLFYHEQSNLFSDLSQFNISIPIYVHVDLLNTVLKTKLEKQAFKIRVFTNLDEVMLLQ